MYQLTKYVNENKSLHVIGGVRLAYPISVNVTSFVKISLNMIKAIRLRSDVCLHRIMNESESYYHVLVNSKNM